MPIDGKSGRSWDKQQDSPWHSSSKEAQGVFQALPRHDLRALRIIAAAESSARITSSQVRDRLVPSALTTTYLLTESTALDAASKRVDSINVFSGGIPSLLYLYPAVPGGPIRGVLWLQFPPLKIFARLPFQVN
jgi:hypothetical protein